MKLQLNCGSCMVKQALSAMNSHHIDDAVQIQILEKIIAEIPNYLDQPTPSHFQTILLEKLSNYLELEDIYFEDKNKQNAAALASLPIAIKQVAASTNPLLTSALLAVEGNSIDQLFFGGYDLELSVRNILDRKFSVNHFDDFVAKLASAREILYIADNAGEIVFDKLFIEQIQKWRSANNLLPVVVTMVVKSGPVLNDATLEDASFIQLESTCGVMESGSSYLGLPLERISHEVQAAIDNADLIISKGQANFETLESEACLYGRVFFLLKAKCLHLSAFFGIAEGSVVFYTPS